MVVDPNEFSKGTKRVIRKLAKDGIWWSGRGPTLADKAAFERETGMTVQREHELHGSPCFYLLFPERDRATVDEWAGRLRR